MSDPTFRPHHQRWLKELAGAQFADLQVVAKAEIDKVSALAGIYVLLGRDGRVVHMGKALRNGGVKARLVDHMAIPERNDATEQVVVMSLDPLIQLPEILAIEGGAADLLRLRGRITGKRWPSASPRASCNP
ncbi:MAG: hypothetical protein HGB30_05155 [Holophagaceae bacterium]|nr:hypothetical protein [Holophagaceae bacterium]